MNKIYVPSDKYPPGSGIKYMVSLFVLLSGLGFLYGFWRGDQDAYHVASALAQYFILVWFVTNFLVKKLVKVFKILSPKAVLRWSIHIGIFWFIFSFIGLYLSSASDQGIFSFIRDRFENGINVTLSLRKDTKWIFHLHGFELLLLWLVEAIFVLLGVCSYSAGKDILVPYSEDSDQWYKKSISLPIKLKRPTMEDTLKNINNLDFNWVTEACPNIYDPNSGEQIDLIFPRSKDIIYASFIDRYWEVTAGEARILIDMCDPKRKTKATRELECWEQNNPPQK